MLVQRHLGEDQDEAGADEHKSEAEVLEAEEPGTHHGNRSPGGQCPRNFGDASACLGCDEQTPERGDEDDRENPDDDTTKSTTHEAGREEEDTDHERELDDEGE